jgi:hypothetical protein
MRWLTRTRGQRYVLFLHQKSGCSHLIEEDLGRPEDVHRHLVAQARSSNERKRGEEEGTCPELFSGNIYVYISLKILLVLT